MRFEHDSTKPTVSEALDAAVLDCNRLIARLAGLALLIGLFSTGWLAITLWS